MATEQRYIIRGGRAGRERLRVLSRVLRPSTLELLERIGVARDAWCLDAGCGGGDVTVELARLAPDGFVIGTDLDERCLDIARTEAAVAGAANIEYHREDATQSGPVERPFDVIYARFLLTHLADPAAAVATMTKRLAPGGALVVEDIDFTGHFCHPPAAAFQRYVELYTRMALVRRADPNIGQRLPALLRSAGLTGINVHVVQPAGLDGDVAAIAPITLAAISDAVTAEGLATTQEVDRTVEELWRLAGDGDTLMALPRIIQAWGRSPGPR